MEKAPLVSIILPVYNGEKYLKQSIESCLRQTYSNIELIIVNDCSTDNTLEIINYFIKQDNRVKLINNSVNKKLPASLNVGHEYANGNYITWTSDDNIYKLNAIDVLLANIINEKVEFVYSNYELIDSEGDSYKKIDLPITEECIWKNVFGACFMYSKDVYVKNNGYDENLFLVEDYDFWLKTISRFKFYKIEESLYYYRSHNENLSFEIYNNKEKHQLYIKNYKIMLASFFRLNSIDIKDDVSMFFMPNKNKSLDVIISHHHRYLSVFESISKNNDILKLHEIKKIYTNKIVYLFNSSMEYKINTYYKIIKYLFPYLSFKQFIGLNKRMLMNLLKS